MKHMFHEKWFGNVGHYFDQLAFIPFLDMGSKK